MTTKISCILALCASLGACTPEPRPEPEDAGMQQTGNCDYAFVGDRGAEPEITVLAMGPDNAITELVDGAGLPLMFPPQAGRVAFVGVRARNVDPCTVELTGALRDPVSNQVRLDQRTINLRENASGMAASIPGAISTWTNVPLCPNQWADQDIFAQPFELTLSLKQRDGRTFDKVIQVVPYCAEPANEADCRCICRDHYVLGMTCDEPNDGGMTTDGGL